LTEQSSQDFILGYVQSSLRDWGLKTYRTL
jgi:hypothetical protein